MEEKLLKLYNECVKELETININILDEKMFGKIDIKISKTNLKRYGCCKNENPVEEQCYINKKKNEFSIKYDIYKQHHIEISKWVMQLDDSIIKNTIMHEIIHCFPKCNNHGSKFKEYANYINKQLDYNIKRLGDKKLDYQNSNIDFKENTDYKYIIICRKCGQLFYRKRIQKNLITKYRCSKCGGKLHLNQ